MKSFEEEGKEGRRIGIEGEVLLLSKQQGGDRPVQPSQGGVWTWNESEDF